MTPPKARKDLPALRTSYSNRSNARGGSSATTRADNRHSAGKLPESSFQSGDEDTPAHFICPITHEIMKTPVVLSDGHTYEATAIERWLSKSEHLLQMNREKKLGQVQKHFRPPNYNN
eukprot:TRINITY_DN4770_c0_g1_i1.p1 TRINITY_DN4770_c0_g1~~TRINITY_DN4770_c0_g1_i1.p1  ORF type:complete len:118 (-),score=11.54 TRINITY_DN4770_c0_g1_i1:77-430(-)